MALSTIQKLREAGRPYDRESTIACLYKLAELFEGGFHPDDDPREIIDASGELIFVTADEIALYNWIRSAAFKHLGDDAYIYFGGREYVEWLEQVDED